MKLKILIKIICFLLLLKPLLIEAQENNSNFADIGSSVKEELFIFSDRDLYVTNEFINFKVDYQQYPVLHMSWSKVVYIELIKSDGTPVAQKKLQLINNKASGYLEIPSDLFSGIYYLKSYTRWMRNFPVENYAYKEVKIVNPKNSFTFDNQDDKKSFQAKNLDVKAIDITIGTDKKNYEKRENVRLEISQTKNSGQHQPFSISVTKKGSNKINPISFANPESEPNEFSYNFLPEIYGISLSGKLENRQTKEPVSNAMVLMALVNDTSFLAGYKTNSDGKFFFTFPKSFNEHDIIIETDSSSDYISINIDDEFCSRPIKISNDGFSLSDQEKELVKEYSINNQIEEAYKTTDSAKDTTKPVEISFYGSPTRTILTHKYIDLPFLEEFIFELIVEFQVSHRKGIPTITPRERNSFSNYPTLTLIDNVPILDYSKFFGVRTNKIECVEIVDKPYIIGDQKFSGVVHAKSYERNIAGIDLPDNSIFFDYKMFSKNETKLSGIHDTPENYPDRRNCLYWNPDISFSAQPQIIEFKTADLTGEYQVLIQTYDPVSKQILYSETSFVVE
ncbi:MAG: hypothetical protein JXA77_14550 [Bacteroidales bacterium]|nr:hypothetical protein [Bacteroidales bacterium]MBN2818831.1 hypothetical protein [Bacteroidales bacterium]